MKMCNESKRGLPPQLFGTDSDHCFRVHSTSNPTAQDVHFTYIRRVKHGGPDMVQEIQVRLIYHKSH